MLLLNLPNMMKEFGPPRYLWEGGNCGEGFLRLAKPTLNKITRNWKLNLHKDLLKFTSFRQTLHDAGLEDILHSNESSKKYICYKILSQIVTILLNKRPISILFFKDEFFCSYYGHDSQKCLTKLEVKYHSYHKNSQIQWNSITLPNDTSNIYREIKLENIERFCIALPNTTPSPMNQECICYYIVSSDWKEFKNGTFQLYLCSNVNYNT